MRLIQRILLLASAAILAAACSFTKLAYMNAGFAYSNATPVLAWMVNDYVDISGTQKDWVRDRLARAMAWHRSEQLPEYRRFFETVAAQSADGITAAEAREAHRLLRGYYHRMLEHLLPDFADFLTQLDAEQLAQLEQRFEKENRKIEREAEKPAEQRLDSRVRRYLDHIEEFTGRLDESQRAFVAERVGAMAELTPERLADRRYRQREIAAIVRAKAPREQVSTELRRLLIDTEKWRAPDYLQKLRARDDQLFDMVAALSATLSPEQRAQVQRRLRGFMREITDLTTSN